MLALTASVSGVIAPGACVSIATNEIVNVPSHCVGVIGIRKSLAKKGLSTGAILALPNYQGCLEIQLVNHSDYIIEINKHDELATLTYLVHYTG